MESHQEEYTSMIMADSRNMFIKGKRTKRTRPPSPLTLTMASTSSTTTTTGASEDNDAENPDITFTPTIEFSKIVQENDEEDMANCLILLAQGQQQSSPPPLPHRQKAAALLEVERTSKLCVYACKTCNRGFSSFQALGGHRASHKKPSNSKPHLEDRSRIPNMMKQDCCSTTLSLQIGLNPRTSQCNHSGSMKVAKIHDCSICGAEFGSGQALGGHMRRHRSMPMATTSCGGDASRNQEYKKPKTLLSLDLNLPASDEDDHREITKLPFRQKDQMIVFSNSSLVHCHL